MTKKGSERADNNEGGKSAERKKAKKKMKGTSVLQAMAADVIADDRSDDRWIDTSYHLAKV